MGRTDSLRVPECRIGQTILTTELRQQLRQADGSRKIGCTAAMDCIDLHTTGKYAHVTRSHVLPPVRYAACAIQYCSEYNPLRRQDPRGSNSRVVSPNADSEVRDAEMSDRAPQLTRLQLHILEVRAANSLSQVIGARDLHDFFRPGLAVHSKLLAVACRVTTARAISLRSFISKRYLTVPLQNGPDSRQRTGLAREIRI